MDNSLRNTLTRSLLVLAVLALLTSVVSAQGGSGELTGLVTDPSGAVVSSTQVTLTNSATGDKRTTVTTPAGVYRFSALPIVGTYTLEAAPKGFKAVKIANIVISVGTTVTQDVKLELGTGNELVTVEAGAELIKTSEAALSQLVDRKVWEQMPLETRSQNEFINLVAGAVPEIFDPTFRGAAVNGTRSGTGNYLVEGVDNNEQGQGGVALIGNTGGAQGGANTSISPDAIQEYRVITHDFNAEYGKAGGFVTDTVLKSGTNKWHGALFEYNRVQALAANDFFSNRAGLKDHLVRNQFGASGGGPIVKDRTFFFVTVEEHLLRQASPLTFTNLTQQFYNFVKSGAFETFIESNPGGICNNQAYLDNTFGPGVATAAPCPGAFGATTSPVATSGSSTVGPIFQSQLQKFPLAMPLVNSSIGCGPGVVACQGEGAFSGQAVFGIGTILNYPVPVYDQATEENITPLNQFRASVKFDHRFSTNDQFNATYLLEDVKSTQNIDGGQGFFGPPLNNPNRAQTLALVYTHTFSPTVLNQLRAGYVRRLANFTAPGTDGVPALFTIDALNGSFGGANNLPQFFTENEFQYKDDISVTKGKHSLKFGGEFRRTRNGSSFDADKNGTFAGWAAEDLITDSVFSDQADQFLGGLIGMPALGVGSWAYAGAAVNPTNGQLPVFYRGYRANEVAMYAQDDWRIHSRLTVNLGLRWEYFGPPHNFRSNVDSNFYFGSPVTPFATTSNNPFIPVNSPFYANEATGRFEVRNTSIWNKDLNNFGPRVGFAWDTTGKQKLVLRSGFGVFYDRIYNNVFENIRFNPPLYCDCQIGSFLGNGTAAGALETPGLLAVPFTATGQFVNPALFPLGLPKARPRHMDQNLVTPYYMQFSYGLQYQIAKDFAFEANYIGTLGRKLIGIRNINTFDGRLACPTVLAPFTSGPCFADGFSAGLSTSRPNTTIGSDNFRNNSYFSNYHGLQATLRKRFSKGLQFNANYTFSKALDVLSDAFRGRGSVTGPTDPMNVRNDYGPADFDARHRFVTSLNYDLPFMKTNRWLGGWSANGIFSWQTGSSIPLLDSIADPNASAVPNQRPAFVGTSLGSAINTNVSPADGYIKSTDFAEVNQTAGIGCPVTVNLGLWCNSTLHRGALHGPHYVNLDFGVDKSFRITEGSKLTFMANFFDLANHPNFDNPQGNVVDSAFGKSQATFLDAGGHRITQLALRFDF